MNQKANIPPILVGMDCLFGLGVRVVEGVTIRDGVVIGAGSVVVTDASSYDDFGSRSCAHYQCAVNISRKSDE